MLNIQLLVIFATPPRDIGPWWNTIRETVLNWKETRLKRTNIKTKHNYSQTTLDIVILLKNKVRLYCKRIYHKYHTKNRTCIEFGNDFINNWPLSHQNGRPDLEWSETTCWSIGLFWMKNQNESSKSGYFMRLYISR